MKKKKELNQRELHSAGATVQHKSPFSELESYVNENDITEEFRKEWVIPFYFQTSNYSEEWIQKMIDLKPKISENVILQNLGDFNWRTRSTGSYFASIMESKHLEDIIGIHLLKSEVCYAGSEYAFTLASFNTKKSADYFNKYLDYYLKNPQLHFNQEAVLKALKYLDEVNGTHHVDGHLSDYETFLKWRYHHQINTLESIKKSLPNKKEEIDARIAELEPMDTKIDTSGYFKAMVSLNRIING
ncbi:MAG: DUF6000 family protein [Saprospiraceae bacterium]|nr:DUF6000 family protein [Saprospiraceae bacterium]